MALIVREACTHNFVQTNGNAIILGTFGQATPPLDITHFYVRKELKDFSISKKRKNDTHANLGILSILSALNLPCDKSSASVIPSSDMYCLKHRSTQ